MSAFLGLVDFSPNLSETGSRIFLRLSHTLKFSQDHLVPGRLVTPVHGMNHPSGPSSLLLFWVCGWDSFPIPYSCMALIIALGVTPVTISQSFRSLTAMSVCPRVMMIHPTSFTSPTKAGADPEQETIFYCFS